MKKMLIGVIAVFLATIFVMMAVPLIQSAAPPRGDYSDTLLAEYRYDGVKIMFDVPADDPVAFKFGLPGGQCTFVDGDDPAAEFVAYIICRDAGSPREALKEIVDWIHDCIIYESDGDEWHSDHWQLPGETLRKGTGDCEDMAILGASMAESLGYRTVLIIEEGHVLFAMECEPWRTDDTVEYGGRTYVTADPTSGRTGWPVHPICITDTIWTPFNMAFMAVMVGGVLLGIATMAYIWKRVERWAA